MSLFLVVLQAALVLFIHRELLRHHRQLAGGNVLFLRLGSRLRSCCLRVFRIGVE